MIKAIDAAVSGTANGPQAAPVVTPAAESLHAFEVRVEAARKTGTEWLETNPQLLRDLNPGGMGVNPSTGRENEYFCYKGIKVCATGQSDRISAELDYPLNKRLHGTQEGDSMVKV